MGLVASRTRYEVVFKVRRITPDGPTLSQLSVNDFDNFDEALQFATSEVDHKIDYLPSPKNIDAVYVSVVDPGAGTTTIKKDVIHYKKHDTALYHVDSTHPALAGIDSSKKAHILKLFHLYSCMNSQKKDGICRPFFSKIY
jgi:hypothetical protein